jgi:hypothetical protein
MRNLQVTRYPENLGVEGSVIIKWFFNLKERNELKWFRIESSGEFFEKSNELPRSTKNGDVTDQLSYYQLLKKSSVNIIRSGNPDVTRLLYRRAS